MKAPQTPVGYYVALPTVLLFSAALSVGLTYAPCYSTLCVEEFYPYTARVHLALFYSLLASVGLALLARSRIASVKALFGLYLTDKPIPWTTTRVSAPGVVLFVWIMGLVLGSTGYWLPGADAFWTVKGAAAEWTEYSFRLTWTSVTGHWCDLLLGLVVLPVGRNSVLAKVLGVDAHILIRVHQILAYALLVGGLIHGLVFYSWLGAFVKKTDDPATPQRLVDLISSSYVPDNPTYTLAQVEEKRGYPSANLPVGSISGIVGIPVMVVTALAILRRTNYNVFYFLHVGLAIVVMPSLCLHASTDFYCLLPGLLLWVGDWIWRVYYGLGRKTVVRVSSAGNGWYRMALEAPGSNKGLDAEKQSNSLPAVPLEHFYISIGKISKIQGHSFTVAATGTLGAEHTFLFRRGPERKKSKARDKEWTWQLAALADECKLEKGLVLPARVEGPYLPQVDGLYTADNVLAIAGGTGVTGALSIASWWAEQHGEDAAKSLTLVWSVRSRDMAEVDVFVQLQKRVSNLPRVQLRVQVTSEDRRLDINAETRAFFRRISKGSRAWVYGSGPSGMLSDIEGACIRQKIKRGPGLSGALLDWHLTHY